MYFSKTNVVEFKNVDRIIYGMNNNIFIIFNDGKCAEYNNVYLIQAIQEENKNGREQEIESN